jgi:trehalose synthase
VSGRLHARATNLAEFGAAVRRLLDAPPAADRIGLAAREHVRKSFVGDRHLLQYAEVLDALLTNRT